MVIFKALRWTASVYSRCFSVICYVSINTELFLDLFKNKRTKSKELFLDLFKNRRTKSKILYIWVLSQISSISLRSFRILLQTMSLVFIIVSYCQYWYINRSERDTVRVLKEMRMPVHVSQFYLAHYLIFILFSWRGWRFFGRTICSLF